MLKDARTIRDALIRCDWDKSELDNICLVNNIKRNNWGGCRR